MGSNRTPLLALALLTVVVGCGSEGSSEDSSGPGAAAAGGAPVAPVADPSAITSVDQAMQGVFIQPFVECRPAPEGDPGNGAGGQVCTNVAISGSTEEGRYFPDWGSCDVVRTQRPFWEVPAEKQPDPNDPRLSDTMYMGELAWSKSQIEAGACTCCHDSRINGGLVGKWDIDAKPIWITTLSNAGLALFAGLADSNVLGAYPPEQNNGFQRTVTGIPSSDPDRMLAFLRSEMDFRGLSEADARAIPPFGGPIYAASVAVAGACEAGQGVDPQGMVHWTGGSARYLYLLTEGSANPGVPPNLDMPAGTQWRLDVRADFPALGSGLAYGSTPDGTTQRVPTTAAPVLQPGTRYQLTALLDVGLPVTNCVFTYGDPIPAQPAGPVQPMGDDPAQPPPMMGGDPPTGMEPAAVECAEGEGFGKVCAADTDCGCAEAPYCALMPGQSQGDCTVTGCTEDASVCPADWSCFDISVFAPGQPSICTAP